MAIDTSSWIQSNTEISDGLRPIFERYLLACPAIGTSQLSNGFIQDLNIRTSAVATEWLRQLDPGRATIQFTDKVEQANELIALKQAEGHLFGPDEYYICYRSERNAVHDIIQSLPEYSETSQSKLGKKATDSIKRRFFEVDALYTHIRNALAHGRFRFFEEEKALFFFDRSAGDKNLSAAGLLRTETLDCWYTKACNLAEKKL